MARTISDSQLANLEQMHTALGELIRSIKKGEPRQDGGPPATSSIREPAWVAEYRRAWKFLKAVEEAGGKLIPREISILARKHGYDPRGLGGFYTGDGSLRREGPYRVLTPAGRRYVRQWEPEFGGS